MTRAEKQLERLVEAVARLISPAEEQRTYLSDIGTPGLADELALEFDDAMRPLRSQFELLGIPTSAVTRLETLENLLSAMGGADHGRLWRVESLDSPEWSNVRILAAETLELLNSGRSGYS